MRGISWLAAEPVSFSGRTLRHGVSKKVSNAASGSKIQRENYTRVRLGLILGLPVLRCQLVYHKIIQLRVYKDLVLCKTSAIALYILWYQLTAPKSRVFLPCLVRQHKSIYLEHNDIASHRFHYNFPRSRLFWEFYHFRGFEKAISPCFQVPP